MLLPLALDSFRVATERRVTWQLALVYVRAPPPPLTYGLIAGLIKGNQRLIKPRLRPAGGCRLGGVSRLTIAMNVFLKEAGGH